MRQRLVGVAFCCFLAGMAAVLSCSGASDSRAVDNNPRTATSPAAGGSRLPQLAVSPRARLDVTPEIDTDRAVRQVVSSDGATLETTAADGSRFVLTIPPKALADRAEIALAPVSAISGLPAGVTLAAAVQLSPDGLLLFEPAVLTIQPARSVAADQEITFAWSGRGEAAHGYPVSARSKTPEFHLTHFSGAGVATGSDAAAEPIVKAQSAPCSEEFFSRVAEMLREFRRSQLGGQGGRRGQELVAEFAAASRRYLNEVLKPLVAEAARDASIFPCVMTDYMAWYHSAALFMGEAFGESGLPGEARAIGDSLWAAPLSNFFETCYSRCMRGESPLFQAANLGGVIRHLSFMGREDLMPPQAFERFMSCSREVSFLVDAESTMSNVYNEQGQGADVVSSVTRVEAHGIVARYDERRSKGERGAVYTGSAVPAKATVSAVWRERCPNQVRVEPGSTVAAVVTPILNPRVGRLLCQGGKPKCESTNLDPGAMVELAPYVVENTYLYTKTGSGCAAANYWSEFLMFAMGSESVGSDAPFQVSGSRTIFRRGTSVRRVKVDVVPAIRAMHPDMKDYVEISTPAINTAVEETRVTVKTQRR